MNDLTAKFVDPGPAWRGKPFWTWNGELNETELIRQIHVLKDMGMGGFFMHSRTGLATEYLGDEWFRLTNACADEAAKLGMEAWLYDEDRWPSGTAGGLITADPQHRLKYISLRFRAATDWKGSPASLASFACLRDGLSVRDVRRLIAEDLVHDGETVLDFTIDPMAESSFYNGATYVDTMSHAATDAFLNVTHERYQSHCGDRLGTSIRGIFTDEPHRGAVMCGFSLPNKNRLWMTPWTETLFDDFKSAFGYDLFDRLPELFLQLNGESVSPVKWQYMELTQRLFLKHFAEPMFAWCQTHNLQLTGHVLHEDSLTAQAAMQGGMMRFYEHMHVPGIDILGEHNRCYWVAKQLDSVAHQLGQTWRLSELYGCTGWQMDFAAHKAVGDWQALFGVNVRCHHLSWVTMAGEAKRDYPASISFQSAWWPQYKFVEDYFARLGLLLSQGQPDRDVLVIHPVESVWCQIHGGWANSLSPTGEAVKELDAKFAELFGWLAGARIDFDYGDEEMLARLGIVGATPASPAAAEHPTRATQASPLHDAYVAGGPQLIVGQAAYHTVVVGHHTTLRQSTVDLLRGFADAGGRVVFVGNPPAHVDALPSDAAVRLANDVVCSPWECAAAIYACRSGRAGLSVFVTDTKTRSGAIDDVFVQVRRTNDGTVIVTLLNTDRAHASRATSVVVDGVSGYVAEWECETGRRYAVPAGSDGDAVSFDLALPAGGLKVFAIGPNVADGLAERPTFVERSRRELVGPFAYELAEPNVCVLDFATLSVDGDADRPAEEVLKVDRAVRQRFGLARRSGEMVQPWFRRRTEPTPPILGRVRLTFVFDVAVLPTASVSLALEQPKRFAVALNGNTIDTAGGIGWWVDPAFRTVPLPAGALRVGHNLLTLEADYDEGVDIEAIYLLGDFGVTLDSNRATLMALPATLAPTDVTTQGLPFYGGPIRYRLPVDTQPGGRLRLELPGVEAACSAVGETVLAWPPLSADVTDAARDGRVDLDVFLTRRNTFGPLHQVPLRTMHYGPDNWVTTGERWSDDYQLYPAGLQQPPVIVEVE